MAVTKKSTIKIYQMPKGTQDRCYKALSYVGQEVRTQLGDYGEDYYLNNINKALYKAFEEVKGLNTEYVFSYFNDMMEVSGYKWLDFLTDEDVQDNKHIVGWYCQSVLAGAGEARERIARKEA